MIEQSSLILDGDNGLPAVADTPREAPPAHDLRHAMMTLAVPEQNRLLTEYSERRNNFRVWLMHQMEEGVHYGVPPGCEPKGNPRPEQWQAQPSLYAAGADLLCDLLGLRAEFQADTEAWVQFGSKPGYVVMVCRLYSRATKELVGEGRGARKEGQKGGDANNAIKMAQKSAKVDAILNGYGLRDVFTQDLEIPTQPLHDNPEPSQTVPSEKPRGKREQKAKTEVSEDQCGHVGSQWKARNPDPEGNLLRQKFNFTEWVKKVSCRSFKPSNLSEWRKDDYIACCSALNIPTLEELEGK